MNLSSQLKYSSLSSTQEISKLLNNGKKVKSEIGPIYFFYDKNKQGKKFAILIKKNIGKAYYRNYIKRIIRFYIRTNVTLFENFNRVIFLYNYKIKKIDYTFLKKRYDRSLYK